MEQTWHGRCLSAQVAGTVDRQTSHGPKKIEPSGYSHPLYSLTKDLGNTTKTLFKQQDGSLKRAKV